MTKPALLDSAGFDQLVAGFYRAATGDLPWDQALDGVQSAFGARAAVMQTVDLASGRIVQLSHGGPPMHEAFYDYLRDWHQADPRRQHLLAHAADVAGRWWHCHEHFDETFARSNAFYRHFLPAHQTRYLATTMLQPNAQTVTAFALELPAERGPLSADEQQLAQRLGRHFEAALQVHERVRRLLAQSLAGHQLLAAFAYPMWLLDADRFVLHANPAGHAELAREQRAGSRGGRLHLRATAADKALGLRLAELLRAGHGARALVDARLSTADAPAWLHLAALEPERVLGAFGPQAQVVATLFDTETTQALDARALADVLGFTPAEAQVATLVAESLTAAEMAQRLGCAESTVRTHIRTVLAKLGARRLADAVRLLRQGAALWAGPVSAAQPGRP